MLAWLGMQVIVFETPTGDGWLLRYGDDGLAWMSGAIPRLVEGPHDPGEQTLDLSGGGLELRLVGGESWTGVATWGPPTLLSTPPRGGRWCGR